MPATLVKENCGSRRRRITSAEMGVEEGGMKMARAIGSFACAALCALTLAGCSAAHRPTAIPVTIEGLAYEPAEVTVAPGDTVVWTNKDMVPHTVTALDSTFDSGSIAAGATWRYVAHEAGTVAYYCTFHPTMKGTLNVE